MSKYGEIKSLIFLEKNLGLNSLCVKQKVRHYVLTDTCGVLNHAYMSSTQTSDSAFFRHYPWNIYLFYTEAAHKFCTEFICTKVPSAKIIIDKISTKVQEIID